MEGHTAQTVLITGGAGFVGANLAERLLTQNVPVRIFDNFSRRGVLHNVEWLCSRANHPRLDIVKGDVRDAAAVRKAANGVGAIFHLAAQVAVTTSVQDPVTDFEVNALGTLNVLEAARTSGRDPFLLYTSTNKVYGSLDGIPVRSNGSRYTTDMEGFVGVTEKEALDFHSPYGCSKGAADQYVRDYARIYDLNTVVFRMSCIAGPRQFGNEDQGWVAHFLYSILGGRGITVYGDGCQVRDILHVHDVVDAMLSAYLQQDRTRGEVYNLGGGPARTVSVLELLRECERRAGNPVRLNYTATRPGDQPFYVSDTTKFESHTGWKAQRTLSDILEAIKEFWEQNSEMIDLDGAGATVYDGTPAMLAGEVA